MGFLAGVILYVLHLPFAVLALRCPLYRERLARVLGLQVIHSGSPFANPLPPSAAADTMAPAVEHAAVSG